MVNTLNLGTLNVAGLLSPSSHDKFLVLQQKSLDILALQEAHCPNIHTSNSWSQFFYPKLSYWTHYTALIINPILQPTNFRTFFNDRIMCIDIVWDNKPITILNIYAPNIVTDRISLFEKIHTIPRLDSFILLGDFNQIINPYTDKFPTPTTIPQGSNPLQLTLSYMSAIDIFSPKDFNINNMSRFTIRNNHLKSASRIDYIFASYDLSALATDKNTSQTHISDHKLVSATLNKSIYKSNNSKWKKLLPIMAKSQHITQWTNAHLKTSKYTPHPAINPTNWTQTKKDLIKYTSKIGSRLKRSQDASINHAQNRISHLEKNKSRKPSFNWITEYVATTLKLKSLTKIEDHTKFLQSGARWTAKGEQPNKFFFSSFKSRLIQTNLDKVTVDNNTYTQPDDISKFTHKFYSTLLSNSPNLDTPNNTTIKFAKPPKFTDSDRDSLMIPFTINEIKNCVRKLPNNKSPGPDGIPYEYYKANLTTLAPNLTILFNQILSTSCPLTDSGDSIMITLYKKGPKDLLKNWRPICLSNTDSKIYSKLLASRIGTLAKKYISNHQFGFVPERNIWDNIYPITNITRAKDRSGALAFLDQEKAYDRVSWPYLISTLTDFNFPTQITNWISKTLKKSQITIQSQLFTSPPIIPSRGLKQGDPLSPLLYNFSIDPLLITLNNTLQGVSIPGQPPIKIMAFADDCVVGLANKEDSLTLEKTILHYESISQAKLNTDKTQILKLDTNHIKLPWKTQPTKESIRHLGILLNKEGTDNLAMETALITKTRLTLSKWKYRKITIIGKTHLINTFINSPFWYKARAFPLSNQFIQTVQSLVQTFLWNSTSHPIKISILSKPKELGGTGLTDIKSQSGKIFGNFLIKILDPNSANTPGWPMAARILISKELKVKAPNNKFSLLNHLEKNPNTIGPHTMSPFSKSVLRFIREFKWAFSSCFTQLKKGAHTKSFIIYTNGIKTDSKSYPPIISQESNTPKLYNLISKQSITQSESRNIWKNCFLPVIPPKLKANTWKMFVGAYRTADRAYPIIQQCHKCNIPDTLSHRVLECPAAKSIWNYITQILIGPEKTEPPDKLIKTFSSNSKCNKEILIMKIITHISLWCIHTRCIESQKIKEDIPFHRTKNKISHIIHEVFYPINFYDYWPPNLKKTLDMLRIIPSITVNPAMRRIDISKPMDTQ